MHELSLTNGIISIINSESEKRGFEKVLEISLVLGEYSGVVERCLREFFPIAAKGSIAENAVLSIKTVKAQFECPACIWRGELGSNRACPDCGNEALKMVSGREFYVESLKVE